MSRVVFLVVSAVALALLSFAPKHAQAALIAQDNFESYPAGNIIGQGTSGSGWAGAYATNAQTSIHNVAAAAISGFGPSLEVGGTGTLNNVVQRRFRSTNRNRLHRICRSNEWI